MNALPTKKVTAVFSIGDIKPHDRVHALKDSGFDQKRFAEYCSVSTTAVERVIRGKSSSLFIALQLSKVTGLTLNQLWPCGKYQKAYEKNQQLMKEAQ